MIINHKLPISDLADGETGRGNVSFLEIETLRLFGMPLCTGLAQHRGHIMNLMNLRIMTHVLVKNKTLFFCSLRGREESERSERDEIPEPIFYSCTLITRNKKQETRNNHVWPS